MFRCAIDNKISMGGKLAINVPYGHTQYGHVLGYHVPYVHVPCGLVWPHLRFPFLLHTQLRWVRVLGVCFYSVPPLGTLDARPVCREGGAG